MPEEFLEAAVGDGRDPGGPHRPAIDGHAVGFPVGDGGENAFTAGHSSDFRMFVTAILAEDRRPRQIGDRAESLIWSRMIGDTLGYDRCCHVSATNDFLWLPDSRVRVHPFVDPPGDDLPWGGGSIEMDGSLFCSRKRPFNLSSFRYIGSDLLPLETSV